MKRMMLVAGAAAVALTAGTAFADCNERLEKMSSDYSDFFTRDNAAFRENQPVLRDLQNAALRLQSQGLDGPCEKVVEAMEEAVAAYRDASAQTRPAGEQSTGEQTAETDQQQPQQVPVPGQTQTGVPVAEMPTRAATREELEARSVPVVEAEMALDTDDLRGTDVYNYDNERIGEADGLLLVRGQPSHLIIEHGGFWNIGEDEIAIPIAMVRWDPESENFLVPISEERVEEAPDYNAEGGEWTAEGNDDWYAKLAE